MLSPLRCVFLSGLLWVGAILPIVGCKVASPEKLTVGSTGDIDSFPSPTTHPAGSITENTAQSGWVNSVVDGITGINIKTALSAGTIILVTIIAGMISRNQAATLKLVKYTLGLSHEREMLRIKRDTQDVE